MPRIWKIGQREIALAADVPAGAKPVNLAQLQEGALAADPMARRDALDLFRTLQLLLKRFGPEGDERPPQEPAEKTGAGGAGTWS